MLLVAFPVERLISVVVSLDGLGGGGRDNPQRCHHGLTTENMLMDPIPTFLFARIINMISMVVKRSRHFGAKRVQVNTAIFM